MPPSTPAGARLRDWWYAESEDSTKGIDWDEAAQVVLHVQDADTSHPVSCLVAALKAELSMFTATDEQWERVALGLKSRLESLGTFLVQSDSEEGGVN